MTKETIYIVIIVVYSLLYTVFFAGIIVEKRRQENYKIGIEVIKLLPFFLMAIAGIIVLLK